MPDDAPDDAPDDVDVLLLTAETRARHRQRLETYADRVRIVELAPGSVVHADDIAELTLAFFSHDAWPELTPNFMAVSLEASSLRWLHTMSAGVDHPVFQTFVDRGVRVTTSSGASAEPIAATVLMYLLALSRQLPRLTIAQRRREWAPERYADLVGRELVIVGWGPIGQAVARLGVAIGMRPTIVRRAARGDEPFPVRPIAELTDAVADAGALVLAVPLTEDTRGLVGAATFASMPTDALFVNVGRGELVDQAALTAALVEESIAGAGLDVFDPEPLPADDPLWDAPNTIITPHNSGTTDSTARRVDDLFFDNLDRLLRGAELRNEIGR
ncbi:MAG: D-2-hydroxyacid dehydrogenase [Actinomycetota bacterium]